MKNNRILKFLKAGIAAAALSASSAHSADIFVPGVQPFGDVPPLALTGFNLSTGTQKAFQVFFSNTSFSGDVSAYPVGTDGRTQLTNRLWSATRVFNGLQACASGSVGVIAGSSTTWWTDDRNVVTRNGSTNIPFRWTSGISAAQKAMLDADVADGGKAEKILRFIRGDRANENFIEVQNDSAVVVSSCGSGTTNLRARVSILGDALHTRPVYVGAPPADFTFDNYSAFKTANAAREPRLFVGANDGMVHVFDADSGVEQWAYIPSMLIPTLKNLAVSPYSHTYYVDGQMSAGDVNFGTTASPDWRTVVVGGLGAGGKGIFALDATDANVGDEDTAKAKILWEITPATTGFADLGYTYGNPVIARMNTGDWAAIINNGYLNGGTGRAVLYIINIKTGALIKAFDTASGSVASPNGLSSAIAIDTSFDGKIDRIYAGDIDGNVWKFDVSATSAASWPAPTKIFPTATDLTNGIVARPIIGAPDVAAHPISGFLVYFSTGRMYTAADAADATVTNYAYGLWDGAPGTNTTFQSQSLTEKSYSSQRVRVSTGLPINWNIATDPVGNPMRKGWRTSLPAGERVIGTGFVRDARYQFTAVNPTIVQTVAPNGENWLIELDYLTGGAEDKPIFDLNSDRVLSDDDRVMNAANTARQTGATGIPVAVYMGKGLMSQPLLANVSAQLSTTLFNDNPYIAPADVPYVAPPPPATPVDLGVVGGHFDVEIYYQDTNGFICSYSNEGAYAQVSIEFTSSTSRRAANLGITLGGTAVLGASPGSTQRNRGAWATWLSTQSNLSTAIKADWTITKSGSNTVVFTAKNKGTVWNNKAFVVNFGASSELTSSHINVFNPNDSDDQSEGGANVGNPLNYVSSGDTCERNQHVHEYDELFNATGMNMLNAGDADYNLSVAIPDATTQFKLLVHNQYLNPAVTLSIGGAPHIDTKNFTAAATLDLGTLPIYTRNTIGTFEFNMPTDAFTAKDWWTGSPPVQCSTDTAAADCRIGLIPTEPGCVYEAERDEGGNLFKPIIPKAIGQEGPATRNWAGSGTSYRGSTGVRHGGALTFQLIRHDTPNSAIELNDSLSRPEFGWRVKELEFENYVLAEYTVFNHYVWRDSSGNDMTPGVAGVPISSGLCAYETNWTKRPIPNTSPGKHVAGTPAPGSADPGAGTPRATITSSNTVTNTVGGVTTTTTTTNFSNGAQIIVTTTTSGGVSTTTSQYIPPPPNSGGSGGSGSGSPPSNSGIGQAVASPNTITGYQQTRNSGKLGRVTWHELFRQ